MSGIEEISGSLERLQASRNGISTTHMALSHGCPRETFAPQEQCRLCMLVFRILRLLLSDTIIHQVWCMHYIVDLMMSCVVEYFVSYTGGVYSLFVADGAFRGSSRSPLDPNSGLVITQASIITT